MYRKFNVLIGFSLAFLFVSTSLPVEAMEKEQIEGKTGSPKKCNQTEQKKKKRTKSFARLVRGLSRDNNQRRNRQELLKPGERKDVLKLRGNSLKIIEDLRKLKEQEANLQTLKNEVKCLTNQEEHLHTLGEAITQIAEKDIFISSPFVSKSFVKNTLIPWVNSSEKELNLTIFTTQMGVSKFKKVEALEEPKFAQRHSILINHLDSPSNVLIVGDHFAVVTAYPWLTYPYENRKSRLYAGIVSRGSYAKDTIEDIRRQLEIAQQASCEEKDYSVDEATVEELREKQYSEDSAPDSRLKHDNSGGSLRKRIEAQNFKEIEKVKGKKREDIDYSEGSDEDTSLDLSGYYKSLGRRIDAKITSSMSSSSSSEEDSEDEVESGYADLSSRRAEVTERSGYTDLLSLRREFDSDEESLSELEEQDSGESNKGKETDKK